MSGGSQHNPNGRQPQLGAGWSHLQVANFLGRAPQAHMGDRGVTWHTPTPPPHPIYHVPAPSPPDPLQAMKASGNSVFRHTATPPDLYRHTPTPPDKHLMRHTPSPGDVKSGAVIPPPELYPHLAPGREKLVRAGPSPGAGPEELGYGRGVDLSVGGRAPNGSPAPASATAPAPVPTPGPALSVRDAPTINSLIARAQPRPGHARVDALLERLSAPASPHSVIVHSRAAGAGTPDPPSPSPDPLSSNEDSADSCGAPPGSKRKRKPERTIRVPTVPPPIVPPTVPSLTPITAPLLNPSPATRPPPVENGDTTTHHNQNGPHNPKPENPIENQRPQTPSDNPKTTPENNPKTPEDYPKTLEDHPKTPEDHPKTPEDHPKITEDNPKSSSSTEVPSNPKPIESQIPQESPPAQPEPHTRRKTRSNSAETIADIAAMVASEKPPVVSEKPLDESETPVSIDKIKSILSSSGPTEPEKTEELQKSPPKEEKSEPNPETIVESAAAPKRRRTRTSNTESTNVPVESPSEAKPAEQDPSDTRSAEPTAASFVEVEKQLENMFAGLEEDNTEPKDDLDAKKLKKRRKSAPTKGESPSKVGRRARASTGDRRKGGKKKGTGKLKKQKEIVKDAYDSGSNASSSRSRGPYIQIRGPRDSPLSVSVINAQTGAGAGEDEAEAARSAASRRKGPDEYRNGLRARGLHASTLGLRYDATTPDATWLCAFCERGPHAAGMGDLFGPYTVDTNCEEYKMLDEASRRRYESLPAPNEVWFHEACAVWAPGLIAAGARLWGLAPAVWGARGAKCGGCGRPGAGVACMQRGCRARTHVPCAKAAHWLLFEEEFRAQCPRHA